MITHCYLTPDSSEHTRRNHSQTSRYSVTYPGGIEGSHTRSALKAEKYVRQAWGPLSALYDESGAQGHPYELLVLAEIQNELLS